VKKLFLLALVALVAGAAFAETAPTFSGTFSTYWAYQFFDGEYMKPGDAVRDNNSLGMKIDLGATIDEWNTVSVSVELADATFWDDKNDNKKIDADSKGIHVVKKGDHDNDEDTEDTWADTSLSGSDELDNRGNYLRLNGFSLKTDVTGALGYADAPVGVTTEIGDIKLGTVNVANVAPLSVDLVGGSGTGDGIAIGLALDVLDTLTLKTIIIPKSLSEKKGETGLTLTANGLADMIDVAAYFIASEWDLADDPLAEKPTEDLKDDEGMNLGVSVAVSPIDDLKFGLGFAMNMTHLKKEAPEDEDEEEKRKAQTATSYQADVSYTGVDKLAVGFSWGIEKHTKEIADLKGDAKSNKMKDINKWKFSASYDILDNLSVYGGFGGNFYMKNKDEEFDLTQIKYDLGLITALKAVEIQVGGSGNLDWKAPEDDFKNAVFVKVSTSF